MYVLFLFLFISFYIGSLFLWKSSPSPLLPRLTEDNNRVQKVRITGGLTCE